MCSTSNPVTKKKLFHYLHFDCMSLYKCRQQNIDIAIFFVWRIQSTTLCYNVHMRQLSRIKFTTIVLFLLVIFIFLHFQLLIKSFFCSVYLQWGEDKNRNTLYPVYSHVHVQILFLFFKCWWKWGWFLAICLFFSCLSGLVVNVLVLLVQS